MQGLKRFEDYRLLNRKKLDLRAVFVQVESVLLTNAVPSTRELSPILAAAVCRKKMKSWRCKFPR